MRMSNQPRYIQILSDRLPDLSEHDIIRIRGEIRQVYKVSRSAGDRLTKGIIPNMSIKLRYNRIPIHFFVWSYTVEGAMYWDDVYYRAFLKQPRRL